MHYKIKIKQKFIQKGTYFNACSLIFIKYKGGKACQMRQKNL